MCKYGVSVMKKSSWKEYGEGIEQIRIDHDSMHRLMSRAKKTITQIWFQGKSQTLENYGIK